MNRQFDGYDFNLLLKAVFFYFISALIASSIKNEIIISFLADEEVTGIIRMTSHLSSSIGLLIVLLITLILLFMVFLIVYYFFGNRLNIQNLISSFEIFFYVLIIQEGFRLFIILMFLEDELRNLAFKNDIASIDFEALRFSDYNSYINLAFMTIAVGISGVRFYEGSSSKSQLTTFYVSFYGLLITHHIIL